MTSAELNIKLVSGNFLVYITIHIDGALTTKTMNMTKEMVGHNLKCLSGDTAASPMTKLICSSVARLFRSSDYQGSRLLQRNREINIKLTQGPKDKSTYHLVFNGRKSNVLEEYLKVALEQAAGFLVIDCGPNEITLKFIQQVKNNELSKDEIVDHLETIYRESRVK